MAIRSSWKRSLGALPDSRPGQPWLFVASWSCSTGRSAPRSSSVKGRGLGSKDSRPARAGPAGAFPWCGFSPGILNTCVHLLGLTQPRNSATACGTLALGTRLAFTRSGEGTRRAELISRRSRRTRLEPGHPGSYGEAPAYERQGKALTNFKSTLPPAGSDIAEQVLRVHTTSISSPCQFL